MANVVFKHTDISNHPPKQLDPGELAVETNNPARLWVGIPTDIDPKGMKLLIEAGGEEAQFVNETGDTMTGALILNADPLVDLDAATKQYVDGIDTAVKPALAAKVARAGDVMTGPLYLFAGPTVDLHAATKKYVDDQIAVIVPPAPFPPGSTTLFCQAAAPTGWVLQTAHNDKALRVVSGAGGGAGGSYGFSTVMAQTLTGTFTLTTNEMAYHSHGFWAAAWASGFAGYQAWGGQSGQSPASQGAGAGWGHNHAMIMGMQYLDLIIASKS